MPEIRTYKAIKKFPSIENKIWNKEVWGAFEDLPDCHVGGNAIIFKKDKLKDYFPEIVKKYPNLPITVKINFRFLNEGFNPDRLIIKNIAWLEGFGVRVYELIKVQDTDGEIYMGQIIEYIDGNFPSKDEAPRLWEKYLNKLKKFHIGQIGYDWFSANFKNEKLLDYDEFVFIDKDRYEKELKERFIKTAYWGNNSSSYQDLPIIGINGCRSYKRFELLGMMDLDLTGKTVLDIGCSGGQTLYWAVERNAERIVGIDTPEIAKVAFEMANFNEYFNIETVGCDLTQDNIGSLVKNKTGLEEFDYVIMFSVNAHVGFHQYMRDLCKDTLFLEANAAEMPEVEVKKYPEELRKLGYTSFDYKGQVNESGGRSLFICR